MKVIRFEAQMWIQTHIPKGARIAQEFYTPDLKSETPNRATYQTIHIPIDVIQPERSAPYYDLRWFANFNYILTSQAVSKRYRADPIRFAKQIQFYQDLASRWLLVATFTDSDSEEDAIQIFRNPAEPHTDRPLSGTLFKNMEGAEIKEPIAIVPILRAGLVMSDAISQLLPESPIVHIGLERNEKTLEAKKYFSGQLPNPTVTTCLLMDPMLATGGTASAACDIVKSWGAPKIIFIGIIGAPEGLLVLQKNFMDGEKLSSTMLAILLHFVLLNNIVNMPLPFLVLLLLLKDFLFFLYYKCLSNCFANLIILIP